MGEGSVPAGCKSFMAFFTYTDLPSARAVHGSLKQLSLSPSFRALTDPLN